MARKRKKSTLKRRVQKKRRRQKADKELRAQNYVTIRIPYSKDGKSPWHRGMKPGEVNTSGVFKTQADAIKWGMENLGVNAPWHPRKVKTKGVSKHEKLNREWE